MKWKSLLLIFAIFILSIFAIISIPKLPLFQENQKTKIQEQREEPEVKEAGNVAALQEEKNDKKEETVEEKAARIVDDMSLGEKVGQLLMVGFKSTEKDEEITDLIVNKHIGSVILFDRNMETPEQVAQLNNSLQRLALKKRFGVPLMIGVDQEGGDILRMREKVSPIPSQQKLGQAANEKAVYDIALLNGRELAAMGFHLNFAPVLDLSETDSRSFGTNPEAVYTYGAKVVQGLHEAKITATLKHFPGNGRSSVDPHIDTSSVKADKLDLENSDIYPFKKLIENTDHNQFFIMMTHIKYPSYDPSKPASLSSVMIQKLLREKLGYKGIVVTDDLEMGAVNKYYSYEDMAIEAINAGADLLLVCHEYEHQVEVYNGLVKAVKDGKIQEKRINEAVTRVLMHKLSTIQNPIVDPQYAKETVGSKEHKTLIENWMNTKEQ